MQSNIYFDGYCPESMLLGRRVDMRLNRDDFWESPETGLQMTVFPPFAAVLMWRGKGQFREEVENATDSVCGLIMAEAEKEKLREIFPDDKKLIRNTVSLEKYIAGIHDSYEKMQADSTQE